MPDRPAAHVFDAYGTLFDVHAAVRRHAALVGPDADRLSAIWRQKQLEYTWTTSLMGRYADFRALTEAALDVAFRSVPSADRAVRSALLAAYERLDAFPDAAVALRSLKARGHPLAILSNGTPAMLAAAVAHAGLDGMFDAVLSVDTLRVYKPDPRVYALATERLSLAPHAVTFVSSNRWDVAGAVAFGFRAVWINRAGAPDEYADAPPVAVVGDLARLPALAEIH